MKPGRRLYLFAGVTAGRRAVFTRASFLIFCVFVNLAGNFVQRLVGRIRDVVVHDGNADLFPAGEDPTCQEAPVLSAVTGNAVFPGFRLPNVEAKPVIVHDRRHHAPRGLLFEQSAPAIAF